LLLLFTFFIVTERSRAEQPTTAIWFSAWAILSQPNLILRKATDDHHHWGCGQQRIDTHQLSGKIIFVRREVGSADSQFALTVE
jgi:hypothetical protein